MFQKWHSIVNNYVLELEQFKCVAPAFALAASRRVRASQQWRHLGRGLHAVRAPSHVDLPAAVEALKSRKYNESLMAERGRLAGAGVCVLARQGWKR
jgi:hypothetical protein